MITFVCQEMQKVLLTRKILQRIKVRTILCYLQCYNTAVTFKIFYYRSRQLTDALQFSFFCIHQNIFQPQLFKISGAVSGTLKHKTSYSKPDNFLSKKDMFSKFDKQWKKNPLFLKNVKCIPWQKTTCPNNLR